MKTAYSRAANGSLLGPFRKLYRAIQEKGLDGCIKQLYQIGDIKFGVLKGEDKFGNKYYEDIELPYGQHRWVEYKDIHNFDSSMIQPDWHGWMHHMYDETPEEMDRKLGAAKIQPLAVHSDAIYPHHKGHAAPVATEQVNQTLLRQRGYGVGSLKTGPHEPDKYYKQPGHPLSEHHGRFFGQRFVSSDKFDEVDNLQTPEEPKTSK